MLIALNPCKNLPLYTKEVANTYKAAAKDTVHVLDPHIYLVAANAFRKMLREGVSQSLIVNGEGLRGEVLVLGCEREWSEPEFDRACPRSKRRPI